MAGNNDRKGVFIHRTPNGTNGAFIMNRLRNIFICLCPPIRDVTRQSSPDSFLKGCPIKRIRKCEFISISREILIHFLPYMHDLFGLANKYWLSKIPSTPRYYFFLYVRHCSEINSNDNIFFHNDG